MLLSLALAATLATAQPAARPAPPPDLIGGNDTILKRSTQMSSKRDARHTTRAVDDDLRDAIAREFWQGAR